MFTVSTRLSHLSRQTNRSEDHLKPKSSTAMSTDSLGEKFRVVADPRDVSNIGKAPGNSSIYLQESVGVAPDFGGEVVEVSGVVHGCGDKEVISKQGLDSNSSFFPKLTLAQGIQGEKGFLRLFAVRS